MPYGVVNFLVIAIECLLLCSPRCFVWVPLETHRLTLQPWWGKSPSLNPQPEHLLGGLLCHLRNQISCCCNLGRGQPPLVTSGWGPLRFGAEQDPAGCEDISGESTGGAPQPPILDPPSRNGRAREGWPCFSPQAAVFLPCREVRMPIYQRQQRFAQRDT